MDNNGKFCEQNFFYHRVFFPWEKKKTKKRKHFLFPLAFLAGYFAHKDSPLAVRYNSYQPSSVLKPSPQLKRYLEIEERHRLDKIIVFADRYYGYRRRRKSV